MDTDVFRPLEKDEKTIIKQKYGIDSDQKVVVFAGRKQEIKGFEIFLEVADRVLEKSSEVCFLAVGSEPASGIKDKSYNQRQSRRIKLLQNKNYKDLPPSSSILPSSILSRNPVNTNVLPDSLPSTG